jgi:general secretion pathway protein B
MSYILEALRKADAERERGSVPDLHAQLRPLGGPQAQVEPPRSPLLPWLVIGVLLAVVGGGAWHLLSRDEPAPAAAATGVVPSSPPQAAPALAPGVTAPVAAPVAVAAAPSEPVAPPAPKPAAKPKLSSVATEPRRAPPAPKASVAAPKAAEPAAPPAPVPPLAELPGELRQQVPSLVIGGSVYSPQASARMVIINGQVFQEGSNLAPELRLEQIRQKTAVFSIRGQRFEVPL